MSTLGTFDSFTTARLGIYAAQHGLSVTGNNISNINTPGYTRQRIDQVSFKTGVNDRYKSMMDNHVGHGALVTGISQIRDPYLDIRYRATTSEVSHQETWLKGLEEIAAILDEVGRGGSDSDGTRGDGILYAQLQDLAEKLRSFSADPNDVNQTLARGSASALTSLFNKYADRLEELYNDTKDDFDKKIDETNEILTNIQSLNKSIRECEITGDRALEMRDERNLQIDRLSELMAIRVEYSMEDVGAGIQVEKLTIRLDGMNPDPMVETDSSVLVDGLYATQLSVPEKKPVLNPDFDPSKYDPEDPATEIYRYMYLKTTDDTTDPPTVAGTNVVNEADKVDNDNFTIQLGKLLDTHGKEWVSTDTTWEPATGGTQGEKAVYEAALGGDIPTKIKIGGTELTVPSTVTTLADLASFVAKELNKSSTDYTITSEDAKIVFTAKKAGAIGSKGPGAAPTLTLSDPENKLTLTPNGNPDVTTPGVDSEPPNDPDARNKQINPVTGEEVFYDYSEVNGVWYKVTITTQHTREIALDDNDLYGSLQAQRELLTEEGEFASGADVAVDENATTKRGIPYYRKSFDLLAQKFAEAYNKLNQGYALNQDGNYINKKGVELTIAGSPINRYKELNDDQKAALEAAGLTLDQWLENSSQLTDGAVPMGGPLFSNRNDGDYTDNITAANISISHSWSTGATQLIPKFEVLFRDENGNELPATTLNINADHMVTMIDKALIYDPRDLNGSDAEGPLLFSGSFNDMFSNMMGVQADDARITNIKLTSSAITQVDLDSQREGVSGVDLNDEAMNMMQYQKAMNAAMRLMTAIDEALDRLINNTGVAGR